MSTEPVTEQQILQVLRQVPSGRWDEVVHFLEGLRSVPVSPESGDQPIRTLGDLLKSDLLGLWKDRPDISDNHEFARALRRRASRREKESNAP
jgi:hypothetical protein